jgi:UDP-4-amino-4,6-dideoxy-N-acetyl-beta-L-altrosamine transaminase
MAKEILGIHGGNPVRGTYLPYGQQQIDDHDIQAVIDILKGDFLTTGPTIQQFEEAIAKYVGAKYAVSFSSGTAALHAACYAAGITEGDEVITTSMTFVASANCILYQGGKPVFADIDYETYNICTKSIEEKITNKTKAIIPVHFTGQPVELDKIKKIANENNLIIIEDAAHALGATYKNQKIGSIGDMTMFSFHPVKHITTGEGGVITTNNTLLYEKLVQFRTHGIERNPQKLLDNHGPWYYEMQFLGYNYRMTDIQAALGLSQLSKLDSFIKIRKKYVDIYNKEFNSLPEIIIPKQLPQTHSSWHLYIIRLNTKLLKGNRKEIYEALQKENIGVNVHYIPVHLQPFYQNLGYRKGLCPQAENLYEEIITLPLFPKMTKVDVRDVIKAVRKVLSFYRVAKH